MVFVNRITQRKTMNNVLDKISNGEKQCIWIEGSSGTGKTYLMKYVKSDCTIPFFQYEDYNWIYKCNESSIDSEYLFFVDVLSFYQTKYPKEFNDFLVKYFNNITDLSWIEALAYIIPNIKATKWAKDLIDKSLLQVEHAKGKITSRLSDAGLKKCFAHIFIHMLREVEKRKGIVLCIDDVCWMDIKSIETLKLMLNIIQYEKQNNIDISIIVTTRLYSELECEKENYKMIESVLQDSYRRINYIRVDNFDLKTTKEYIKLMERKCEVNIINNIHMVTHGNPQELFQTLKFDDGSLENLVCVDSEIKNTNYISSELLMRLESENTYSLPIILTISLIQKKITLDWVTKLTLGLCNELLDEEFNPIKFDNCINILAEKNIIDKNITTIDIIHDSLKETAIEYIKYNGEYENYMNCITSTLRNSFELTDEVLRELMYLYSQYDSNKCYNLFKELCIDSSILDRNTIKMVAQCLVKDYSVFSIEEIENYIVPVVLEKCIQLSYYDLGYNICKIIYTMRDELNHSCLFQYYISFSKILIDKGILKEKNEVDAIKIIDELVNLPGQDTNQKVESFLVAMSAYEHLLDFDNIKKYNNMAQNVIDSEEVTDNLLAMFYRNQGLVKSHCDLEEAYLNSLFYSNKIEKDYDKKLMLGTCNNNIGLHYLYSSNIKKAIYHFKISERLLDDIGYDNFRVINNLAICYLLIRDLEKSYNLLLKAKAMNINCVFEKICIQNNIAILEYMQGKKDVAREIISNIISEYQDNTKQTSDNLVYSSAMVNMGYFCYLEDDYANSAKWYKESKFFNYRYNDDLQKKKRDEMIKLNMNKLGIIEEKQYDLDLENVTSSIFKKMYAPIAFAYYII